MDVGIYVRVPIYLTFWADTLHWLAGCLLIPYIPGPLYQ